MCLLKCMGSGILTSVFIKVYGEWDSYKCVLLKCMGSGILTSVFY